ncbi:MAG TPA: hypothetical protein VJZ26_18755 [Blastocatellia bacterium]|nr:hypothetical protein [Blastocatellia bacterium]
MRKAFVLALACVILSPSPASSQRRRRSSPKRSAPVSKVAEKSPAEIQAARERVAAQIKVLSQFLYLLGGITKGIESADQAARNREASSLAVEQNERNKAKVKESLRNVREGLDKLETDFRSNPKLKSYYPYIAGVARIGETAENQAAANRFDEAGRSLVKAANQLADALAAMR